MIKKALYNARKIADELKKEALDVGIPLSENTDLLKLAADKIRSVVDTKRLVGMDLDDLILGTLSKLLVREPVKAVDSYNLQYIRDTYIPNYVLKLKSEGLSLENILDDKTVQRLLHTFNLKEDHVTRSYSGEKKPARIVKIKLEDITKTKDRPSIFKKFKGDTEGQFIKYWTISVGNTARNYLRDNKDEVLDTAVSVDAPSQQDDRPSQKLQIVDTGPVNSTEGAVDRIEANKNKEIIRKALSKINPKYEIMLDNFDQDDEKKKELVGILGSAEYSNFKLKFERDLKKIIIMMKLTREETSRMLRAKKISKIAYSIVRRYLDADLL